LTPSGSPTSSSRLKESSSSRRGEDVEAFIVDQLARWKPATAANRCRSLRVFYGWLQAEGEIPVRPMARMRPPRVPDQPVPVVREDAFRRLLETCADRDFEARRDTALILLLADVGPRRAEVAGMRLTDLDFDLQVAVMVGKDGRQRALPFGRRTAQAP
jgi:site-specific recombinase XerC